MERRVIAVFGACAPLALGWQAVSFAQSGVPTPRAFPPPAPLTAEFSSSPEQQFSNLIHRGDYLAALKVFEAVAPTDVSERLQSSYTQYRPALDGFIVRSKTPASATPDPAALAPYDGAAAEDALRAIVERARNTRIVIVNEAHDDPRDRAFILKVAEALRPIGFTHYAAETLTNFRQDVAAQEIGWLETAGYPRRNTGTYTVDPMFAYLIRRVVSLGYRPVGYEITAAQNLPTKTPEEDISLRERAQADNLAQAIAAAGPSAKFLIHVGYAHAAERPMPPHEQKWMAAQLTERTGMNPLTVDQTDVAETSYSPQARALHRALAARMGRRPAVFFKSGRPLATGTLGRSVDLQVIHPLIRSLDGRPDWLRSTGRRRTPIPARFVPREGRRLVQAFAKSDGPEAIPLDQALVSAGSPPPVLYLPSHTAVRWAVQE